MAHPEGCLRAEGQPDPRRARRPHVGPVPQRQVSGPPCGHHQDAASLEARREASIIDTLEPIVTHHSLVVRSSDVMWDYSSTTPQQEDERSTRLL